MSKHKVRAKNNADKPALIQCGGKVVVVAPGATETIEVDEGSPATVLEGSVVIESVVSEIVTVPTANESTPDLTLPGADVAAVPGGAPGDPPAAVAVPVAARPISDDAPTHNCGRCGQPSRGGVCKRCGAGISHMVEAASFTPADALACTKRMSGADRHRVEASPRRCAYCGNQAPAGWDKPCPACDGDAWNVGEKRARPPKAMPFCQPVEAEAVAATQAHAAGITFTPAPAKDMRRGWSATVSSGTSNNAHVYRTTAAPTIGESADDDHDGQPDAVGVDDTGENGKPDGVIDRNVPVEVIDAPNGRRARVAFLGYEKDDAPFKFGDTIKSASEYQIGAVTRPLNEAIEMGRKNLAAMKRAGSFWFVCVWLALFVGLFGGAWMRGAWIGGVPRSVRVLDLLYRQGHVPPVAEKAARRALIEDGAGDPEGNK